MNPTLICEPLNRLHARSEFTTTHPALERFLRQQARQEMDKNVSVSYVLRPSDATQILGYYTLSASAIVLKDLPEALRKKLPHYPVVPAILLGRLAIDSRFQGQGLGAKLLIHALKRAYQTSRIIGAVAVVVDAIDQPAVSFYRKYGFTQEEDDPQRLFIQIKDLSELAQ